MKITETYTFGLLLRKDARKAFFDLGLIEGQDYIETKRFLESEFTVKADEHDHKLLKALFIEWSLLVNRITVSIKVKKNDYQNVLKVSEPFHVGVKTNQNQRLIDFNFENENMFKIFASELEGNNIKYKRI